MELTQEEYDGLPEYAKGGFAESDGKFLPVKDAALKSTLDNLDKEKRDLESKVGELTKSEESRLAELEAAKATAREEAIAEAGKKGNWEEQERLMREKFDDELKRAREEERGNVSKEFSVKQAAESLASDMKLLASEMAIEADARVPLEIILNQRAKLDDNGNRVYYGDDGSALSITELKAFSEEFAKSPTVARLVKGKTPTKGSGLANGGGQGGGGADQVNEKAEAARKAGNVQGFLQSKLKIG